MSPYTLDAFPTHLPAAVAAECLRLYGDIFPGSPIGDLPALFEETSRAFTHGYRQYQPMDTKYHDLEHALQCTLCLVRLLCNRHEVGATPALDPRRFRIAVAAILLHDSGYMKEASEMAGTGAKYTFFHERRSCEIAALFLGVRAWDAEDIAAVQRLISCTGPRSRIDLVPFADELEAMLGRAVCTADYVGQMSDPKYPDKLPGLFQEFEESDDYRRIPHAQRIFKSLEELLKGTPFFWEKMVVPRLDGDCAGLYRFLAVPYPDGPNPYVDKIQENVRIVRARATQSAVG